MTFCWQYVKFICYKKIELIRNEVDNINIFKNIFNNALKDFKDDKYKKIV